MKKLSKKKVHDRILEMRTGISRPENENHIWKDSEISKLKREYIKGIGISELAVALERSESAIYQELDSLGFYEDAKTHRNRSSAVPKCLCAICKLKNTNNCSRCPHRYNQSLILGQDLEEC